jgi:hypothetical protein
MEVKKINNQNVKEKLNVICNKKIVIILCLFSTSVYAESRTYTGNEDKSHCTLWNREVLRWPQKILGLESMECRRKAVPPTVTNTITCRLKRQYVDPETDERMCIYERGATGHTDLTVAMDKYFQCPRTQQCTQSPGGGRNTLD